MGSTVLKTLDIMHLSGYFLKKIEVELIIVIQWISLEKLDFICELFKNQDPDKFDYFIHRLIVCFVLGYKSGNVLHMHFISQQAVESLIWLEVVC